MTQYGWMSKDAYEKRFTPNIEIAKFVLVRVIKIGFLNSILLPMHMICILYDLNDDIQN